MEWEFNVQPKTYFCEECQSEVNILRWKSLSTKINGPEFRCDDCWDKLDNNLEQMIMSKLRG
jgi:hypothetical protein